MNFVHLNTFGRELFSYATRDTVTRLMANKQHLTANYLNEDKNHKHFAEKSVLYTNKNMHEKERKNMEVIFEIV